MIHEAGPEGAKLHEEPFFCVALCLFVDHELFETPTYKF